MERRTNGATVRVVRELLGISLTDLAARADITKPYMSQIETGVKQPSPTVARAIADGMGVPLESITYPVAALAAEPVAVAS